MTSPSEPAPPRTFRPLWARRVIYPLEVLLAAGFVLALVALSAGEAGYPVADRIAIVLFGSAIVFGLHRVGAVRVRASEQGVDVVNIARRRRLEWAEIVAVRLDPGEPWLTLDLDDGTVLAAMGIQGSDGDYARRQANELARLVLEHTRTERDT